MGYQITEQQLKHIYREAPASRITRFVPILNRVLAEYDITTPQRIRMFLAQIGHESGQLRYLKEIASGEAYEGRKDLGNIVPGDGVRYKGRGLIQLTGRANYALAASELKLPLIEKPELLEEPENAARVSAWFWKRNNLNAIADSGNFRLVTKRINGGYNGYADRYKLYHRALEVI